MSLPKAGKACFSWTSSTWFLLTSPCHGPQLDHQALSATDFTLHLYRRADTRQPLDPVRFDITLHGKGPVRPVSGMTLTLTRLWRRRLCVPWHSIYNTRSSSGQASISPKYSAGSSGDFSRSESHSASLEKPGSAHLRPQQCSPQRMTLEDAAKDVYEACSSLEIESDLSSGSSGESLQGLKPLLTLPDFDTSHFFYDSGEKGNLCSPSDATTTDSSDGMFEDSKVFSTSKLPSSFCPHIATNEQIRNLILNHSLPTLMQAKWKQDVRYIYWAVYRNLWVASVLINAVVVALVVSQPAMFPGFTYHQASIGTGINFLVAAFGKQEHAVNLLFRLTGRLPLWMPLRIRRQIAHAYTYGGLHAGCGISAFLWYIYFTFLLVKQFEGTPAEVAALGPTTAMILAVLLLVLVTSLPGIRTRWYNQWELSHRYGGWAAISLSWAQTFITLVAQAGQSRHTLAYEVVRSPTFWILSLISICLIYPWIRLRRRKIDAELLSSRAVRIWFRGRTLPTCVGLHLSHSPLLQNHTFAAIPNHDENQHNNHGYSVVVTDSGDWTHALVSKPPSHIYTRGAPAISALRIAALFRPIVLVATGPGIGPCLSFLQAHPDHPVRIIWTGPAPDQTYGADIVNAIMRADPAAVIVDTERTGHPDLPALAYALYEEIGAEIVVVSGTAAITRQLVYDMEVRGIAAFGPIL